MNLESRFASVNGLDMHFMAAGDGPPVLLLHGFPDTHVTWRRQIPVLAEAGMQVIAPDLRGYGKTGMPPATSAYAISFLADDVLRLMDFLRIEKAAIVGHDWGGLIGWHLAMHAPDRVTRFAALSTGHPAAIAGAGLPQLARFWYIVLFMTPVLAEKLIRANDWASLRQLTRNIEQQDLWRDALSPDGRLTAALNYYRANFRPGAPRNWKPVDVPVMGVWSERDPALGEKQMADSARHCRAGFRFERLDNAGHWLQLSAADRLNPLLLDFLATDIGIGRGQVNTAALP